MTERRPGKTALRGRPLDDNGKIELTVIPREELEVTAKLLVLDEAIVELIAAGDEAWQDLHDWTHTARGLRERSKDPDHDNVPHQRGIDQTERIATRLGRALEALRTLQEAKR